MPGKRALLQPFWALCLPGDCVGHSVMDLCAHISLAETHERLSEGRSWGANRSGRRRRGGRRWRQAGAGLARVRETRGVRRREREPPPGVCRAASESGTACATPVLMRSAGMRHRPCAGDPAGVHSWGRSFARAMWQAPPPLRPASWSPTSAGCGCTRDPPTSPSVPPAYRRRVSGQTGTYLRFVRQCDGGSCG